MPFFLKIGFKKVLFQSNFKHIRRNIVACSTLSFFFPLYFPIASVPPPFTPFFPLTLLLLISLLFSSFSHFSSPYIFPGPSVPPFTPFFSLTYFSLIFLLFIPYYFPFHFLQPIITPLCPIIPPFPFCPSFPSLFLLFSSLFPIPFFFHLSLFPFFTPFFFHFPFYSSPFPFFLPPFILVVSERYTPVPFS